MTNKKFVIENHSPYFLHPFEGPQALVTTVIFGRKNYDIWEKLVRTPLKSKNKLGFIEGRLKKPTPKEEEYTTKL